MKRKYAVLIAIFVVLIAIFFEYKFECDGNRILLGVILIELYERKK